MKMSFKLSLFLFVSMFFPSVVFPVAPPDYPKTLYIPVTYYDFHSDSSNPEFEITPSGTPIKRNMVDTILGIDRKPKLGPSPYYNRRIDRWFRKWIPGDFTIYNYYNDYPARYQRYSTLNTGLITLNTDTSFKNIVIQDSLLFLLDTEAVVPGTYYFKSDNFFPLDGRGFVDEVRRGSDGNLHNFSFSMELHWEFTKVPGLTFNFKGDDDVWAFVGGKLRMDLGGIHQSQTGSFDLNQATDLIDGQRYNLDFFYVERHVTDSKILITTNILSPIFTFDLNIYPNSSICPFDSVTLRASVSDDISGDRPDLAQNTRWRIIDPNGQPDSVLKGTTGQTVAFVPVLAYSRVTLEGAVFDGKDTLRDTVTINVGPCAAYKIYIEANPVDTTDTASLRSPQELDRISILENMVNGVGYAIARDRSGAYVRLADSIKTVWSITPDGTSFARAEGEDGKKYRGTVTRTGREGNTYAVAEEPGLLPDSVLVVIASYYIVRLQLRDTAGNIVDTIQMTTDELREYNVWGLKSTAVADSNNPTSWVPTNVKWDPSDSIKVKNAPPERAQSWVFDPVAPGTGTLTLTNPDDARTDSLVIPVFLTRSPPRSVTLDLITPAPRRAGDTLLIVAQIFNTDGLVPGSYCFGTNGQDVNRAVYGDTLGTGGGRHPNPTLQVDGIDTLLNILNQSKYSVNECFSNGIDTIKVVLFYAPFKTDSAHQISVSLGPNLKASTERFTLLPSVLDSIGIEDVNYRPLDPQILTGNQSVTPYSDGYDQYGNRIGFTITDWSTDGTLNPIDEENIQTYITATGVPVDQQGYVCASAYNGIDSALIKACLSVTIIGPKKNVASALTRDLDGDGYLDAIELHFDRVVAPSELAVSNFSNIVYSGATRFTGASLTQIDSMTYRLHFSEIETVSPQTSWRIYFDMQGSATIADTLRVLATDGAGPVIWKITKDVSTNKVTVWLSEKVKHQSGNSIQTNDTPAVVFNVYRKNSSGTFDTIPLLADITGFKEVQKDSILIFIMSNGEDLSLHHWMNLEANPPLVKDYLSNNPHLDNIKRKVEPIGQRDSILIAPNPTRADFNHTGPGTLLLTSNDNHWRWASRKEGALIRVIITPDSLMSVTLKIYDMVGNLVNWSYVADYLTYLKSTGSLVNQEEASMYVLDIYWNGSNHEGMKVAPGIYKVVFYLDYRNSLLKDVKLNALLGISK